MKNKLAAKELTWPKCELKKAIKDVSKNALLEKKASHAYYVQKVKWDVPANIAQVCFP